MKKLYLLVFASFLLSTVFLTVQLVAAEGIIYIKADASVGSSTAVKPIVAEGIICIRANASVEPSTAPILRDGDRYAFTQDVHKEIVVERSDITIDGAGHLLEGNEVRNGLLLNFVHNVTVTNLTIKSFYYGVVLNFSRHCVVTGNEIIENDYDGVSLINSSYNIISKNNITANICVGIQLITSSNNTIAENIIAYNGIGVAPFASSNRFYHNDFADNYYQLGSTVSLAHLNFWDDGHSSGNWWSDYTGLDNNGDGIGDVPYEVDIEAHDNYPLMKPSHFRYQTKLDIVIYCPENKTYIDSRLMLELYLNEPTSWIGYSLDGRANVTTGARRLMTHLSNGTHSIVVYATDKYRLNTITSETIYFRTEIKQDSPPDDSPESPPDGPPEDVPSLYLRDIEIVIEIIAVALAVLLVYFVVIRDIRKKSDSQEQLMRVYALF